MSLAGEAAIEWECCQVSLPLLTLWTKSWRLNKCKKRNRITDSSLNTECATVSILDLACRHRRCSNCRLCYPGELDPWTPYPVSAGTPIEGGGGYYFAASGSGNADPFEPTTFIWERGQTLPPIFASWECCTVSVLALSPSDRQKLIWYFPSAITKTTLGATTCSSGEAVEWTWLAIIPRVDTTVAITVSWSRMTELACAIVMGPP